MREIALPVAIVVVAGGLLVAAEQVWTGHVHDRPRPQVASFEKLLDGTAICSLDGGQHTWRARGQSCYLEDAPNLYKEAAPKPDPIYVLEGPPGTVYECTRAGCEERSREEITQPEITAQRCYREANAAADPANLAQQPAWRQVFETCLSRSP